jgi:excisionase family DNA binding protein
MAQPPTTVDRRPLLSPRDVADIAGISLKTVYREIDRDNLAALRAGHQLRIDPYDFRRWLEREGA